MRKVPFLRLTMFLILGILIQDYYSIQLSIISSFLILTLSTSILSFYLSKQRFEWIGYFGYSILLMFFSLGMFACKIHELDQDKDHYHLLIDDSPMLFQGKVVQKNIGKNRTKYLLEIETLQHLDSVNFKFSVGGALQLFCFQDSFQVGDEIRFISSPTKINSNSNDYTFNYQKFCNRKRLYYQAFTDDVDLISRYTNRIVSLRNYISLQIESIEVLESSRAVLFAMLLGAKDHLGEIEDIFRKTGTSHVLAISGLHVGIISAILFFVLSSLPKKFQGLKYILIVFGIWLFCLLSGLAPSTVRACIMMTCFFVGKYFKANGLGYNFVFLAAFFMLLNQPMLIYDIGFQFSFLAILGILYFFEPLSKVLVFRGIKEKLWQMLILSLCAQLLIIPISLYYFHQFPILFAITSIIAIPATFLIIAIGLFTIIIKSVGLSIGIVESLLDWFISIFLSLLEIFANYDFLIIDKLWPTEFEVVIYYTCLFGISAFFNTQKIRHLYLFLGSFLLLLIVQFQINFKLIQPELIVYADPKNIVIDIIQSGSCLTIHEEGLYGVKIEWNQTGQHNKSHVIEKGLFSLSKEENHVFKIEGFSFYILNKSVDQIPESINLLLLNSKVNLSSLCISESTEIIDFAYNKSQENIKSNYQFKKQF